MRGAVLVDLDRRDLVVDHGTTTGRIFDALRWNRRARRFVTRRIGDVCELVVAGMELRAAHAERLLRCIAPRARGLGSGRTTRDHFGTRRRDDRASWRAAR